MIWRWDQGRLDYFQIDEIRRISKALMAFNGHSLPRGDDPDTLRATLEAYSDRPFLPDNYKVWRNYKRVFGCQLLATDVDGIVICTDLCKQMAKGELTSDDYLVHVAKHFYFPSPVFDEYTPTGKQVFPMCAIIKLLVSEFLTLAKPFLSFHEIIDRIKGNGVVGTEAFTSYGQLKPTGTKLPSGSDEIRQIREMLRFMSQLSFLKWENPNLYLDVDSTDSAASIAQLFTPMIAPRKTNPSQELLQLGQVAAENSIPEIVISEALNPFDIEFIEGIRTRSTHLRIERSSKLKELYFAHTDDPHHCNMCDIDTIERYPWADRLVELHHLLPLSSPVRVESKSTSLKDIVGLCPSCHRATHKYYSKWLTDHSQKDFSTYAEAHKVYDYAKSSICL